MVVTPHCGDHFLSVDLRIDEISATGSHRFFAHAGLPPLVEMILMGVEELFGRWNVHQGNAAEAGRFFDRLRMASKSLQNCYKQTPDGVLYFTQGTDFRRRWHQKDTADGGLSVGRKNSCSIF